MPRHTGHREEPASLEVLPVYFDDAAPPAERAPRAGFRLLAVRWAEEELGLARPPPRSPLLAADRRDGPSWPDYAVRRLVWLDAEQARVGLAATIAGAAGRPGDAVVAGGRGWLSLPASVRPHAGPEPSRIPGRLHVSRCARPVAVELVLTPWSAQRSELRLQLGCRRRTLHVPRRYFDVAHDVMDALRAGLYRFAVAASR